LRARIKELQTTISDGVVALEIRTRSARVQALQKRWDYLRAGLDLILDQRGMDCWCAATRGSNPTGW